MKKYLGFTMIEIIIVLAIIMVLSTLSMASFEGSRLYSRDAKRKADIEQIRSALEVYRSDCHTYPASLNTSGDRMIGTESECMDNVYMREVPRDPKNFIYGFHRSSANGYAICAHLERCPDNPCVNHDDECGGAGSCGETCNYIQYNP